jgi:hypothetical protein
VPIFEPVLRGLVTAVAVALLLLAAQRWGRSTAGLLAGLPTVTGPALAWLALDHGALFAAEAAAGGVAAGAACALFALGYARASRAQGRWVCLLCGLVLSLLPLPWMHAPLWTPSAWMVCVVPVCLACLLALPPHDAAPRPVSATTDARQPWLTTALVSGVVSALASALAPQLGPFWAGMLTSPPLLAAALALTLHHRGSPGCVMLFLRGYTAGLIGRSAFAALFGTLVVPAGLLTALCAGVLLALAIGWVTAARLARTAHGR